MNDMSKTTGTCPIPASGSPERHSLKQLTGEGHAPRFCLGGPRITLALQTGSGIENFSIIYSIKNAPNAVPVPSQAWVCK